MLSYANGVCGFKRSAAAAAAARGRLWPGGCGTLDAEGEACPALRKLLATASPDDRQDEVEALVENNFNCPVFRCVNPTGCVPAGGSKALQWVFAPERNLRLMRGLSADAALKRTDTCAPVSRMSTPLATVLKWKATFWSMSRRSWQPRVR